MPEQNKQNDNNEKKSENTTSFKFAKDGFSIELNIYINIYNNNDNNNNLANQGGKAGVTLTATDGGQISGDRSSNVSHKGQISEEFGQNANQSGQIAKEEGKNEIEEGNIDTDFSSNESDQGTNQEINTPPENES